MLPTASELAALQNDLGGDLLRFGPELAVTGGIIVLLLARLVPRFDRIHLVPVAIVAVGVALLLVGLQWRDGASGPAFSGLLQLDPLAVAVRALVLTAALLVLLLTRLTGLPDSDDSADFAVLLLGATLGMMTMASANHLLMVFLAVEMASLPSYALAGFLKGRRQGSEAALKYVIYGAAASGVMLYGLSLLAGSYGTGSLPVIAKGYAHATHAAGTMPLAATAGLVFLMIGLGFKLAAVPFHFWLPDVFEGAAAEVGAFLSVASKAAAVGLTARILLSFQGAMDPADRLVLPATLGLGLAAAAAVTATLGNLAALPQTNLKRMLAYSTVAHAGYMLMGLATLTVGGVAAVLFYLAAYLLMNIGAFAVVAIVRNRTGSEDVTGLRGMMTRSPAVGVALAVFLLSLLGLPPLAGFAGKFQVFAAVYEAGQEYARQGAPSLGHAFTILLGIGVVNTVISAGFYLKVLRSAGLDEAAADEKGDAIPLNESWGAAVYLVALAVGLVVAGIWWGPLADAASAAVAR